MQRGSFVSPATLDRAVTRPDALEISTDAFRRLEGLVDARAAEIGSFADHIDDGVPASEVPIEGHRYYWQSDFSVHQHPTFFASLKTVSERTRNTESIHEENLKGRYLTGGALYVTLAGDEYRNIFPVWDWTRIPGVTAYVDPARMTEPERRRFAGGLQEGSYGVNVLDYGVSEGSLEAKKGWFFGDETIACLGSGIDADEGRVQTTIAQRHLRGDVQAWNAGESTSITGTEIVEATRLRHDGLDHRFPEQARVEISAREQTGSWYDINHAYDETVTKPVFTVYFDHGMRPTDKCYVYSVSPTVAGGRPSVRDCTNVEVVANSTSCQAVCFPEERLYQAVFHERDGLQIDERELRVDGPCLIQYHDNTLTIADPTCTVDTVSIEFDGRSIVANINEGAETPPQEIHRF